MSMTDTTSYSSATESITSRWSDRIPCVRYGFPDSAEQDKQAPRLTPIDAPIPAKAETASPVYLITDKQYQRQQELDNPYRVTGTTPIATELQDECEQTDSVIYPVHIESDAYPEVSFETMIERISEFVESHLGCDASDVTFYFSGRRSIHAHVPRCTTSERARQQLKDRVKRFCDKTGATFDLDIYSRKRQFRLPGVHHQKTDLPKVRVEPHWDHDRIVREAANRSPDLPESYTAVLADVFSPLRRPTPTAPAPGERDTPSLPPHLNDDEAVLSFQDEPTAECPLIEQEDHPDDPADMPRWAQYNYQEFSPYAHAAGNDRSVAILKVKGGAFAKQNKRDGATMIPAYFYGARGCNGEFTKANEHAPLQLSDRDFAKWEYTEDDRVVVIGGQSRQSKIAEVESWHAIVAGHALTGEEGSRRRALEYLQDEGYDIGSVECDTSNMADSTPKCSDTSVQPLSARTSNSEAAELQRQAEQNGIETLSHKERWRIACRLLRVSDWSSTRGWFREQFGSDFKPGVTWQQLRSVVQSYPDEYNHIDVPPEPQC